MSSLFPGRLLVLIGCVAALASPAFSKARYIHATSGNIDIVSSMSEERTTRFLHELVGIRLVIEDLFGTPVLQTATQVIVVGSRREMDDLFPEIRNYSDAFSVTWHCSTSPHGDTFSIINYWPNDKRHRQAALRAYASWLISRSLPNCPYWIYDGLSEFLCTAEYRDGTIRFGETIILDPNIKPAKRIPLAETLAQNWASKDNWGLWRMWLTEDYDGNRVKTRRLAELLRQGAAGNADTVGQAFGQTVAEMQPALYRHMRSITDVTVNRPAAPAEVMGSMFFNETTPFEMTVAKGLVFAALKNRPPGVEVGLRAAIEAEPESPRPLEAMARLRLAEHDTGDADEYWKRAAEKGSLNSYAYLVILRESLEGRATQINLQPSLSPERTAELRQLADRCAAINPGQPETFHWSAWIEAIAPISDATRVDRVTATHARYLRPGIFLPLVIANIRLQRFPEASVLLDEYERILGSRTQNQAAIAFLRKKIPSS